jgi:hypothetical protein
MKIEIQIHGNNISEKWATAKAACQVALENAVARANTLSVKHKEICGQNVKMFSVPDGEHFRKLVVYTDGQLLRGSIDNYNVSCNVMQPINEHWMCSLIAIVELTVALNSWQPFISEN